MIGGSGVGILAWSLSAENAANPVEGEVPILCQAREEEVEHDDRDKAGDETLRTRAADSACAGTGGETLVTGDQCDGRAEKEALDEAFVDRPEIDAEAGELPVGFVG